MLFFTVIMLMSNTMFGARFTFRLRITLTKVMIGLFPVSTSNRPCCSLVHAPIVFSLGVGCCVLYCMVYLRRHVVCISRSVGCGTG